MHPTPLRSFAFVVAGLGHLIREFPTPQRTLTRIAHFFLCWLTVYASWQLKGQFDYDETRRSQIARWDIDHDGFDDLALQQDSTRNFGCPGCPPVAWDSIRISLQFLGDTDGFLASLRPGGEWSDRESIGRQWILDCPADPPELLWYSTNLFGMRSPRGTNIVYRFSDPKVQEFVSGFQVEQSDGIHYGWVRVRPRGPLELDSNGFPIVTSQSFVVDFAIHYLPGEPITLGFTPIPEPILSAESVHEFQIFGSRCERFSLRTRRVVHADQSVSILRTIEGPEILSQPTEQSNLGLGWEAVAWPHRTQLPSEPKGEHLWKRAPTGVLLLEEHFDPEGNKTASFGPLSKGKPIYVLARGSQSPTRTWALINPSLNCLARGKGVTGSPAPPESFDERFLDIDSDGLLDITIASTSGSGSWPDTFVNAYPIADFDITIPRGRGSKIDGSLQQLDPSGVRLSTISCDLISGSSEFLYTYFGLVKHEPDGRHFGWLQIIPVGVPLTRIWFEEEPETPATAGRYPPPELRVRTFSIDSRSMLEFTVLNGREDYELQTKIGIGNGTWRTISKGVPSKFTLPTPPPNLQVYRLISF